MQRRSRRKSRRRFGDGDPELARTQYISNDCFDRSPVDAVHQLSERGLQLLYGRVEVGAKLPKGRGTWPAIWIMPTDNAYGLWPDSGEIDIMEHVGYDPGVVLFV